MLLARGRAHGRPCAYGCCALAEVGGMTGGWALDHARPKRVKSPWPLALGFLGRGQAHEGGKGLIGPGPWAFGAWALAIGPAIVNLIDRWLLVE